MIWHTLRAPRDTYDQRFMQFHKERSSQGLQQSRRDGIVSNWASFASSRLQLWLSFLFPLVDDSVEAYVEYIYNFCHGLSLILQEA